MVHLLGKADATVLFLDHTDGPGASRFNGRKLACVCGLFPGNPTERKLRPEPGTKNGQCH